MIAERFMPSSDIEAEASEWLIRLETDRSGAAKGKFEEWIAADARNRATFVRLEKTWRHADVLRKLRPLDGDVDENVLDKFGQPAAIHVSPEKKWPAWLAVAAAVLFMTGSAFIWMAVVRTGWQVYKTDLGGFQRISLADGSTAMLNTNSEIRVKLTPGRRQVVLSRGEALFTVAHDVTRPFDVAAADTIVRAVGTAFAVRLEDQQQVDVIVTEGRVAIDPPDDSPDGSLPQQTVALPTGSTLMAGETVTVKARRLNVQKIATDDMTRKLAWTQGRIWFDSATVSEAVLEFNRYNRRQLIIDDPAIAGLHVGGAFDATDLDGFVAALQSFGIRAISRRTRPDDPGSEVIRLIGTEPAR
jgi:transmembrane sensor